MSSSRCSPLLAALALWIAGCGSAHQETAQGPEDIADEDVGPDRPTSDDAQVTLLNPGAEPRRKLRYHLPTQGSWTLMVDVKSSQTITVADLPERSTTEPTVRMEQISRLRAGRAPGNFEIEQRFGQIELVPEPGMPPELVEKLRSARVPRFDSLFVRTQVTPRGELLDVAVSPTDSLPPKMRMVFDNFRQNMRPPVILFPKEPVGVGAKWETDFPMNSAVIKMPVKLTQTLEEVDGDRGVMSYATEADVPTQELKLPQVDENLSARLESAKLSVQGTTKFDLSSPLVHSDLRTTITMAMTITDGQKEVPAQSTQRIRLRSYPKR